MNPPAGMEWQLGKTAASIQFVKQTEAFLSSLPPAKFSFDIEAHHELLRTRVARVKSGEVVLLEFHDYEQQFAKLEADET